SQKAPEKCLRTELFQTFFRISRKTIDISKKIWYNKEHKNNIRCSIATESEHRGVAQLMVRDIWEQDTDFAQRRNQNRHNSL
ncbi:MAG: hypothetical protein NC114_11655, partial [Ruminococcus flavefaciens]|nr:hypothetical protein [Ruminococcus flavefaciens]